MPVRLNLSLYEANPEKASITIVQEDNNAPQSLTGAVIEVYVKPTRETADTDLSVVKLSTVTSEVVVVSAANGTATITFPNTLVAGTHWWRADVIITGQRKTCAFGSLVVENT